MDEARLYTVRVWRHAGQWRAVVQAVGDEGAQLFTEAGSMAGWLLQADRPAARGAACGEPGACGEPRAAEPPAR